jgi:hypothetical protein
MNRLVAQTWPPNASDQRRRKAVSQAAGRRCPQLEQRWFSMELSLPQDGQIREPLTTGTYLAWVAE